MPLTSSLAAPYLSHIAYSLPFSSLASALLSLTLLVKLPAIPLHS